MHEIGVVRAMVKTVTDYAAANQIDEISEIVADCGELSLRSTWRSSIPPS